MMKSILIINILLLSVTVSVSGQNRDSVKEAFNQYLTSQLLLDKPDYNEAIDKGKSLIALYPTDVDCYTLVGSIYERRNLIGDTTLANTYYFKALSLNTPPAIKAVNEFGKVSYNRALDGNIIVSPSCLERAQNLFIKSLSSNEKQEEILLLLSSTYELNLNYSLAGNYVEKLIKLNSNNSRYYKKLAELNYKTGDLRNTIVNYELAISTNDPIFSVSPEKNSLFLLLAKLYIDLNDFTKAQKNLQKFIPLNQEDSLSLENESSVCYLKLGDTTNAITSIEKSLTISNRNDSELIFRLVKIYEGLGKNDKIIETYSLGESRGLISCKDWLTDYDAISSKVNVLYFELYSQATNPEIRKDKLFELGNLYHACSDYYSCIKVMNDYIMFTDVKKDSALAYIAASFYAMGKYAVALDYVSKVYEINKDVDLVKVIEIYSLYYSSQYDNAFNKLNQYNVINGILTPEMVRDIKSQITRIKKLY